MSNQPESSYPKGTKRDFSKDDNSVVSIPSDTMEKLHLFRGNTILIKGKKGKDAVGIALVDDACDEPNIRTSKVVRTNFRVRLGDVIFVHQCPDAKYGKRVHILSMDDSIEESKAFEEVEKNAPSSYLSMRLT